MKIIFQNNGLFQICIENQYVHFKNIMSRKYLYVDKSISDVFSGGFTVGLTPLETMSTKFWIIPYHTEPNKNRRKDLIDTWMIVHFEQNSFEIVDESNSSLPKKSKNKKNNDNEAQCYYLIGKPGLQKVIAKEDRCPMNLNDKFKLFGANESDSMDAWFLSEAKSFIQNYVDYKSNNSEFDLTLELNFRSVIQDLKDYWYDSVQSRYTQEQTKGRFTHIPNIGNQNDIRELKIFDIIMDYLQFVQDSVIEHIPQGGNESGHPIMIK